MPKNPRLAPVRLHLQARRGHKEHGFVIRQAPLHRWLSLWLPLETAQIQEITREKHTHPLHCITAFGDALEQRSNYHWPPNHERVHQYLMTYDLLSDQRVEQQRIGFLHRWEKSASVWNLLLKKPDKKLVKWSEGPAGVVDRPSWRSTGGDRAQPWASRE